MMVVMMTSLPAVDCSTFLPLRRKKLDCQWFGDGSVVQPVPRSTMNIGVVGPKVQRPTVGRQPSRHSRHCYGDFCTALKSPYICLLNVKTIALMLKFTIY